MKIRELNRNASGSRRGRPRSDWRDDAACLGRADEHDDPWFPDRDSETASREAIKLCRQCPVVRECLIASLKQRERWGVWGGLTARQRTKLLRPRFRKHCPVCRAALVIDLDSSDQVCAYCGITWKTPHSG